MHPCVVHDFRGTAPTISPFNLILALDLLFIVPVHTPQGARWDYFFPLFTLQLKGRVGMLTSNGGSWSQAMGSERCATSTQLASTKGRKSLR